MKAHPNLRMVAPLLLHLCNSLRLQETHPLLLTSTHLLHSSANHDLQISEIPHQKTLRKPQNATVGRAYSTRSQMNLQVQSVENPDKSSVILFCSDPEKISRTRLSFDVPFTKQFNLKTEASGSALRSFVHGGCSLKIGANLGAAINEKNPEKVLGASKNFEKTEDFISLFNQCSETPSKLPQGKFRREVQSTSNTNLEIQANSPAKRAQKITGTNSRFRSNALNPDCEIQARPQPEKTQEKASSIRAQIGQLCKEGQLDEAMKLFYTLSKPNIVTYNTLIVGFICNRLPKKALEFYSKLVSTGLKPDHYTYSAAMKACTELQELRLGMAIHSQIILNGVNPNQILYNSLLSLYCNCLDSHSVQSLFDKMPRKNSITYNTMISWFVRNEQGSKALELFNFMLMARIQPTIVSFVNIFPASSLLGLGFKPLGSLHGLILKHGPSYYNCPFAVSTLICAYCEISAIDLARKIFDRLSDKNVEVWNTMINGYLQNNFSGEALELFQLILVSKLKPDIVTLLVGLTTISQAQVIKFGRELHAYLIKTVEKSPLILSNALIAMYARCDGIEISRKIFDRMVERDLVSWNTMVSACVQNGFDLEGLELVREMLRLGFHPDSITVTALASASSNLRDSRLGKQTHAYILRNGVEPLGLESYLIDMYAKSGLITVSELVFDKIIERDTVVWNAMIAGYVQNGVGDKAFAIFQEMQEQGCTPNSVTIASLLPVCNLTASIRNGCELHCYAIRHFLDQNVFVDTALIDMYGKCGSIASSEKIFNQMPQKNTISYTTMISCYGLHGHGQRALELFNHMPKLGIKPDRITYVAVLSACAFSGLVDEGMQIFDSMVGEKKPGMEHHCCVVDMLGRAGRVREAYEFVENMGAEADVRIWGSLLGACKIHGELELGKVVAKRLFEVEKGLVGYHVLLSNMYALKGRWESVDMVRRGIKEMGLKKEPGCSWIEVGGWVHLFVAKDQKHPQSDEIYGKLRDLDAEMRLLGL
ncbi:hypothetical protein AMTRI_Chr03g144310 [Amborella trichopoda]